MVSTATIRVWRRDDPSMPWRTDWHVSVGDEAPLAELRRAAVALALQSAADQVDNVGGMAWDEALEAVSVAMIAPGAMRPQMRWLEPPAHGWHLVVEIVPSRGCEFEVRSDARRWTRLQLGEALATFVRLTFPVAWLGFRADVGQQFALQRVS